MNRKLAAVLFLVAAAAAVFVLLNRSADDSPVPLAGDANPAAAAAEAGARQGELAPEAAAVEVPRERTAVATELPAELPASVRAALVGFTGRVVDQDGEPVADSLVRMFRIAPDAFFQPQVSLFAEGIVNEPRIVAGSARSGDDGRFTIRGVYPRAVFVAHADADGDAPTWRVIQRDAPPGELCDVGDIRLQPCGVLTGTVLDADGEPLAGALVRAVDLPGTALSFVPLERFDPTGAIIVSEDEGIVIVCPRWLEARMDELPIARTTTGNDGRFRLTGVPPGGNVVAVTASGFMSHVRPREVVDPGEEKELGEIRMREGEFAYGKIVDGDEQPIAGAEVLVAAKSPSVPAHFASFAPPTGPDGAFELGGFPPGDVVVAARRRPGEPWTIAPAQPVTKDLVVTLPSAYSLTLEVVGPDGQPVEDPRLQLSPGAPDEGSLEQLMWGVTQPVALDERRERTDDGRIVLRDLPKGEYTLLATSPAHATTALGVKLEASTELRVPLAAKAVLDVAVLDPDGAPVEGAAVFALAKGDRPRVPEAPVHAGHTGEDGRLRVDEVNARRVALTATHPAFGNADLETDVPPSAPVVLRFEKPGSIDGIVAEAGAPPPLGKWMVYLFPTGGGRDAAFPVMPQLTAPDAEGRFRFTALRPGSYRVGIQTSLDVVSSAGKIGEIVAKAFLQPDLPAETVQLAPGGRSEVVLDTAEGTRVDGPSARITGSVTISGRLGSGHVMQAFGPGRRRVAEVDRLGRFDLGQVAVGTWNLQLIEKPSGDLFAMERMFQSQLWSRQVEVEEGKDVDLTVDVQLGSIQGVVLQPDGRPAAGARVRAQLAATDDGGWASMSAVADGSGAFELPKTQVGTWSLSAHVEDGGRGTLDGVVVSPGVATRGVRLTLSATYRIRGRVDRSTLPEGTERAWMNLEPVGEGEGSGGRGSWTMAREDGSFEFDDVLPGRYRVRIGTPSGQFHHDGELVVGTADLEGVLLRPVADQPAETREASSGGPVRPGRPSRR